MKWSGTVARRKYLLLFNSEPLVSLLLLWPSKRSKSLPTECDPSLKSGIFIVLMDVLPAKRNVRNSTLFQLIAAHIFLIVKTTLKKCQLIQVAKCAALIAA